MSGTIFCSGTVTTSSTGAAQCVDGGGAPTAWTLVPDFDFTQLDTPTAYGAFAAGFVICGLAWGLGKSFGEILGFIR